MAVFRIRLAGKTIKVESIYEYVKKMCRSYICESDREDFQVTCSNKDIAYEKSRETEDGEFSDDYLESLSIYRSIAEQMLEYSTFLMHAAVVAVGDEAFMFTAASGVGKTTRVRIWLDQIEESYVVNGDKPLIRITDEEVIACGTPWSGKEKMNTNTEVPLRSIILLERSEETSLTKISFSEAIVPLFAQIYRPKDPLLMTKTIQLVRQLDKRVDIYRYRSNLNDTDMRKVYETIRSNNKKGCPRHSAGTKGDNIEA